MPRNLSDAIKFSDFLPRLAAKKYHRRIASFSRTASFRIHMTHQDSSGDQEWPVRMFRGDHPAPCCDEPRDQDDESSIIADSMTAQSCAK